MSYSTSNGSSAFSVLRKGKHYSSTTPTCMQFSPDGDLVVIADSAGTLTIHSTRNLAIVRKMHLETSLAIRAIVWYPAPHCSEVIVGFSSGQVISYVINLKETALDAEDKCDVGVFKGPIEGLAVSAAGHKLCVAYGYGTAIVKRLSPAQYDWSNAVILPAPERTWSTGAHFFSGARVLVFFLFSHLESSRPAAIIYETQAQSFHSAADIYASRDSIVLSGAVSPNGQLVTLLLSKTGLETHSLADGVHSTIPYTEAKGVDMAFLEDNVVVIGTASSKLEVYIVQGSNRRKPYPINIPTMSEDACFHRLHATRFGDGTLHVISADGNVDGKGLCVILHFRVRPVPRYSMKTAIFLLMFPFIVGAFVHCWYYFKPGFPWAGTTTNQDLSIVEPTSTSLVSSPTTAEDLSVVEPTPTSLVSSPTTPQAQSIVTPISTSSISSLTTAHAQSIVTLPPTSSLLSPMTNRTFPPDLLALPSAIVSNTTITVTVTSVIIHTVTVTAVPTLGTPPASIGHFSLSAVSFVLGSGLFIISPWTPHLCNFIIRMLNTGKRPFKQHFMQVLRGLIEYLEDKTAA